MIVVDTHALVWWVSQSPDLSVKARQAIDDEIKSAPVIVSAISIFEIATLVRRHRLHLGIGLGEWMSAVRALPELRIEPVSEHIAQVAGSFEEPMHGDPADRVIAATAVLLSARLVTADEKLRAYPGIETVW